MASLIIAAGILAHNKIKDRKDAKKEKKQKLYQDRYTELEKEHKHNEDAFLQRRKTQNSFDGDAVSSPVLAQGRSSSESQRSDKANTEDSPSKWVEEALKDRDKTRSL